MLNETQRQTKIEFTGEFKHNLKMLAKKYRHIQLDIQPIIETLKKGIVLGNQIPKVGYPIFKVRATNRDIQKGKSAGYRIIYYQKTKRSIVLITIYSKTDQSDISAREIKRIIQREKNE